MTPEEPAPSLRDFSPLTALARAVFAFAKWLSPMQWLSCLGRHHGPESCWHLFRSRGELAKVEVESWAYTRRRAHAIETYVVAWLLIELLIVVLTCQGPWGIYTRLVLAGVVISRITEIMQVTVNATLFDALSGRPDQKVASKARMIVLAGINYIELTACFGVVYATDLSRLHGAGQPATAFYLSIITQLTIGYGDVYPVGWLRAVAAAHGLMVILFVVLVLGRFIAALAPVEGIFEVPRVEVAPTNDPVIRTNTSNAKGPNR